MTTLSVIDEKTGARIGAITRAPGGAITTTGLGQSILDQISTGKGWDTGKTFDALAAGGWSNGYITVKAAQPAAA